MSISSSHPKVRVTHAVCGVWCELVYYFIVGWCYAVLVIVRKYVIYIENCRVSQYYEQRVLTLLTHVDIEIIQICMTTTTRRREEDKRVVYKR